jgi:hypothetical protein
MGRGAPLGLPLCVLFAIVEIAFLVANGVKFLEARGSRCAGGLVFTVLRTWRRGRELLHAEIRKEGIQLDSFLPGLMLAPPARVPGTAIFMTAQTGVVPHALLHNLKHNKVLHERNVFLTVDTMNVPYAPKEKRLKIDSIGGADFYRVVIKFGFMETPDVPLALMRSCDRGGIHFDPMETTYSPAARPWSPAAIAACPSGATSCSRSCTATRRRRPDSSASRVTGWWNWARRSRSRIRNTPQPPFPARCGAFGGFACVACDHIRHERRPHHCPGASREDEAIEASIRPKRLDEYLGQQPCASSSASTSKPQSSAARRSTTC